jgi:hypothetical protein
MTIPALTPQEFNDAEMFGLGNTFNTTVRMIESRWKRTYPRVAYYALKKNVTNVGTSTTAVSGSTGTTTFDPLWGEAVAPAMQDTGWQQPHLSAVTAPNTTPFASETADVPAAETEVRDDAVYVHMRVQRTLHETMLKKLGFDRVRTLVGTIPASMLDRFQTRPQPGDRIRWNAEWYEVEQFAPGGAYNNTTVWLYWVLNLKHARLGS